MQMVAQRLHARIAGLRGIGLEDGAVSKGGDAENGLDFVAYIGNAPGQHTVDLGQCHAAATHAQQLEDFKVFYGLGHDAVIGSDDQQRMVDAHGASGHGVNKFLVTRHVDDAQHIPIGQRAVGIAQFDGDAAGLFFFEAVGLHACEGAYQRGFAVVNMACGSNDHGLLNF